MVKAIPDTLIFGRWRFETYKILEQHHGHGFTKLLNVATEEVIEVSPDALRWNYITQIPQEKLQQG